MYTTTKPYFPEDDIPNILDEIRSVLENKELLTMGNHVTQFEQNFSKYIGSSFGIATNSCSSFFRSNIKSDRHHRHRSYRSNPDIYCNRRIGY